jgi:hypothetical protein
MLYFSPPRERELAFFLRDVLFRFFFAWMREFKAHGGPQYSVWCTSVLHTFVILLNFVCITNYYVILTRNMSAYTPKIYKKYKSNMTVIWSIFNQFMQIKPYMYKKYTESNNLIC